MKRNRNLKRSLALFLAAAMCAMNMTAVTAFAAEADESAPPEEASPSVTITVDVSEAPVPDDADTATDTQATENPDGSSTETTTTDKTWSDTGDGGHSSSTSTEGSLPGDVTDPDVSDGEYVQVDTTVKVDTTVTTEGSETKTDSVTTESDGFVSGISGSTDGKQDVTTETTTETTTTTATVNKETGEVEKTDGDKTEGEVQDDGDERTGETVKSDIETSQTGSSSGNDESSAESGDVSGLEVTVGPDAATDEDRKTPDAGELPAPESYLKDLSGYELSDAAGNVLGTVQADGKVLDGDGNPVDIGWSYDGATGEYRLDFTASWTGPEYETGGAVKGDVSSTEIETSTGASSEAAWNDLWEKSTATETLPDGTVRTVDVYTHKGTGTRVDTKTWTELWDTVQGMAQDRKTASLSVSVKPGEDAVLNGTWLGATENDGHGDASFNGIGDKDYIDQLVRDAMNDAYSITDSSGWQSNHLFFGSEGNACEVEVVASSLAVREKPGVAKTVNGKPNKTVGYVSSGDTLKITAIVNNDDDLWGMIAEGPYKGKWIHLDNPVSGNNTTAEVLPGTPDLPESGDAKLTGSILQSTIWVNRVDEQGGQFSRGGWLREMTMADGSVIYVYCADHDVDAVTGSEYDIGEVGDALGEEANGHLQYIAENGYWGTPESLEAVKSLVADEYAGRMTDGIALAVTQAAVWFHACGMRFDEDPFTKCFTQVSGKTGNLDPEEVAMARELFEALIGGVSEDTTTDFIGADSITSTTIKVNDKIETSDAEIDRAVEAAESAAQEAKGDRYDTDLSFTIAVVPSRLHDGGLKVVVYQGTDKVEEKYLSELEAVEGEDGVSYTLKNVVLTEGVSVSIDLTGVQQLGKGAYLFRSEIDGEAVSQPVIGVADGTGTRDVNVSVGLDFSLKQGTVDTKAESSKAEYTDTWTEITGHEQDKKQDVEVEELYEQEVVVTTTVKTETKTETESGTVRTEWHDEYEETYERPEEPEDPEDPPYIPPEDPYVPPEDEDIPEEPTPLDPGPELPPPHDEDIPEVDIPDEDIPLSDVPELDEPEEEIPDEDIPLSDIPQTGDDTAMALYAVLMAVSAIGLCGLAFTRRKEQG